MNAKLVVFTDLDGTLLNHDDYTFDDAIPALNALASAAIPVVCNTSKTAAELLDIRNDIANTAPFICENGAAVYLPISAFPSPPQGCEQVEDYWRKSFVQPRSHWQQLISHVDAELKSNFTTFNELGTRGIVAATGLTTAKAEQANQREFNEPVLWHGTETAKNVFISRLEIAGATLLQGGRFLHVGGNCNKATAMQWLSDVYAHAWQCDVNTIALGDSGNDIAMLNAADFAIAVRSPTNDYPKLQRETATYLTQTIAPSGWQEGIRAALHYFNVSLEL